MSHEPLIALVHAIPDSIEAPVAAFRREWPEAELVNIVDDSLYHNLSSGKTERDATIKRFRVLTDLALGPTTSGRKPQALLFCCSAFAYAIEVARADRNVPILTPAEAGIEQALDAGRKIGLVVTAAAALPPLVDELAEMARKRGQEYELITAVAEGAIEAFREGRMEDHDCIVADTLASMPETDVVLMGQFTMSRAALALAPHHKPAVLTTPGSAVRKLRSLLGNARPASIS